jgi:hypothetical protein
MTTIGAKSTYSAEIDTPSTDDISKYASSIDDSSTLNAKDFIAGASDEEVQDLAAGILEQLGIENPTQEMLDDVATLIKINAKKATDDTSISNFVTDVIVSLQEAAGEDDTLTEDELETGITQEAKEVLASDNAQFSSDADDSSLYDFLNDVLLSIGNGNNLTEDDAALLNELLGLEDEALAKQIIEQTGGNVDNILEFIASSEEYTANITDDEVA